MSKTEHLFKVHKLNEQGLQAAQKLADGFNTLAQIVDTLAPLDGRAKSIAFTKLEEASFFAKKAMAENEANQLA